MSKSGCQPKAECRTFFKQRLRTSNRARKAAQRNDSGVAVPPGCQHIGLVAQNQITSSGGFGATGKKIVERIGGDVDHWNRLGRNQRQRLKRVDQASSLRWCDVLRQLRASTDRAQFVQLLGAGRKRERAALVHARMTVARNPDGLLLR